MARYQVQDPAGETHIIEGPEGATPAEVMSQAQSLVPKPEEPTIPQSLGHSFVNNLPLGGQAAAVVKSAGNDKGYSENLGDWNKQTDLDKAAHPVAYGVGSVAGAVAPLALGGIPEVAEAFNAAPIVSNAVLGGLQAISNQDLTKDPAKIAQNAAVGAGIGAGTAGILGKVFPQAETLDNFANRKAIQSLELPNVGEMTPADREGLASFIQDNGLVGRDKAAVLEHARGLSKNFGTKIGEIADKVGDEGLTLDSEAHLSKVNDLLSKAQEFKGSANREAKALARDYTAGASDLVNLSDNPTWGEIQKLKEQYGKLAFKSTGEIKSEGAKDTYFALKDMLKSIVDKAQNSNLAPEYKSALAGYSQMQPIETALEKSVNSEFKGGAGMGVRGMIGLVKKLPGPIRAVVGPAAAALGHPYIGAMAALPELTSPVLQSKAASALSKGLPGIEQGATQEVTDFLTSRFAKPKNYMEKTGVDQ